MSAPTEPRPAAERESDAPAAAARPAPAAARRPATGRAPGAAPALRFSPRETGGGATGLLEADLARAPLPARERR